MASGFNQLILGLCILGIFCPIVECRMREIFGARCEARCLAKTINSGQTCTGSCKYACNKPCADHETFFKVKSCMKYCSEFEVQHDNLQCRGSCKYLMKLYNTGAKTGECRGVASNTHSCGSISCMLDKECPNLEKCCQQSADCGKTCQTPSLNVAGYPTTPTALNSTFIKKPRSVVVKWSHHPRSGEQDKAVVFLVEVRHISVGSQQGVEAGEWKFVNMTNDLRLKVHPESNTWTEYRVLAVKEYGTSDYSTPSPVIYILPEKPTPPRNFRVKMRGVVKGKVRAELTWSKPEKTEVPIHRYRVFWSRRLDSHTKELMSLRVHHKRISPNQHSAIINGLRSNTTYVFELQAICRYKGQRLRSDRVYLMARTVESEPANKEVKLKKIGNVFRNSYKKPLNTEKTKAEPSGYTLTLSTVSSVVKERPENTSSRPDKDRVRKASSSSSKIYGHGCWSTTLLFLLFYVFG